MSSKSKPLMKLCLQQPCIKDFQGYEKAVRVLNTLQTNANVLQEAPNRRRFNIEKTIKYLKRVGVNLEDIENKIIHIAGTKGKGTTAFIAEALLRACPNKTGLFTSPHLICVRERIRINGAPLSMDKFVHYFWSVYNKLEELKEHANDMPSYFKFLTVMALKVFLTENVDVAIIEVGIGGELDCTNVFKRTPIVGITSLGLDHTTILGHCVEQIAWQKAGIMKQGSRVFTVPTHSASVLNVLKQRASEKECQLELVPDINSYLWKEKKFTFPQKLNASLSLQLAKAWICWNNNKEHVQYSRLIVSDIEEQLISSCHLPGRCQILKRDGITFFLDGAHTLESMLITKEWFLSVSSKDAERVLIFNTTGSRESRRLLEPLVSCNFSETIFCTNTMVDPLQSVSQDLMDNAKDDITVISKVNENKETWNSLNPGSRSTAVIYVSDALSLLNDGASVLITGSIRLVGSVLTLLHSEVI